MNTILLLCAVLAAAPQFDEIPAYSGRKVDKQISISSGEKLKKSIRPAFTRVAPVIDGDITDRCYELVEANPTARASGFDDPSGSLLTMFMIDQTEVKVLRDKDNLYIAARCNDKNPKSIRQDLLKRDDVYYLDDYFMLYLDSFHDKKSCYYFALNPRGTQFDGIITQEGETFNSNWDGIWDGAATIDENGWTVEMRIPFRILKFSHADGNWGVNFYRMQRKEGQGSQWVTTGNNLYQVSQFGNLEGMGDVPVTPTLDLAPYVAGGRAYRHAKFNASLTENEKQLGPEWFDKEGIDITSRLFPSISLTGAYHPDFSQIEADPDQVNLTGEELFLNEKRPIFLEGQDLYDTPLQMFYSRRVGDIEAGGRINGRFDRTTFDVMDLEASDNWSYLKVADEPEELNNYAVMRLKQDFATNSAVGFTGVNKEMAEGRMLAFSGDTKLDFWKGKAIIDGQFTSAKNESINDDANSWLAQLYHNSDYLIAGAGYESIGTNFQSILPTSYQPYDNLKGFWTEYKYYWYTPWQFLMRVSPYVKVYQYRYVDGPYDMVPRDGFDFTTDFYFSNKWQLTAYYEDNHRIYDYLWYLYSDPETETIEHRWLEHVPYHNRYAGSELTINPFEFNTVTFGYEGGTHFDYNLNYAYLGTTFKPLDMLSVGYSLDYQSLNRYDDSIQWWINRLNLRFQFTRELYCSSFLQLSDISNMVTTNFLIGYQYRRGSDIYLAYNNDKVFRGDQRPVMNRIFLLKGTFWLGI